MTTWDYPGEKEGPLIRELGTQLNAMIDNSGATPAAQAFAAIKVAARYAARAQMPVEVAFAALAGYVVRGEAT